MAQSGSAPIALGLGGIATVLLISGIQGKSIASIIQGDFGKPPDPGYGGSSESATGISSSSPVEGVTGGVNAGGLSPSALTPHQSYSGNSPYGIAPSPITSGSNVGVSEAAKDKRAKELKHGLEVALHYKETLEAEYKSGRVSKNAAEKLFADTYPWYATWARELSMLEK